MTRQQAVGRLLIPRLKSRVFSVFLIKDKMPAREAFCTLARRVGEYVNPEDLDEREVRFLDELFGLFEKDIPEVFYNGWKGEKVCAKKYPSG